MPAGRRWGRKPCESSMHPAPSMQAEIRCSALPTVTQDMKLAYQSRAKTPSYILQHYHSTGCAGGAFSWRAAMMDPSKDLILCTEPREYRQTSMLDIQRSKDDKRRGGGPRVGPFQECIPGKAWNALPKYDMETNHRSSAFNEQMHVEWENHVDHILANDGELPTASVVAKAGFRSCSPCCRDMLALARPTGKTFIMVDLAEDDNRGTFHFVTGDKYLPVPKEALEPQQLADLKRIVSDAQCGAYKSSQAIYDAVMEIGVPIDEQAQHMYLGDPALMPVGVGADLHGTNLLKILHAEHFARLTAEYGASILRDDARPTSVIAAVLECRNRAKQMLIAAWKPNLSGLALRRLNSYADAAVTPLLPESIREYAPLKHGLTAAIRAARRASQWIAANLESIGEPSTPMSSRKVNCVDSDVISLADASTTVPEDDTSDPENQDGGWF
eukprot:TRINITY_DN78389_c0_g1_i1.p1 TRINITY_DN78389_c0_g1~~TRINITY_DN78389_c0_g1_i1.p1  ORF type:complete len:443 (-),score=76.85 TRINITY_DN78389_c0_g1_i1:161-1489(-)